MYRYDDYYWHRERELGRLPRHRGSDIGPNSVEWEQLAYVAKNLVEAGDFIKDTAMKANRNDGNDPQALSDVRGALDDVSRTLRTLERQTDVIARGQR